MEYLRNYVREGGAAVKFLIPPEDGQQDYVCDQIRRVGEEEGYTFVTLDSAATKIHMIDKLFHEVARQIDWEELAYHFLVELFRNNGYEVPPDPESFGLWQIAEQNDREEKFLRKEVQKWLEKRIFRDYAMTQEFRLAMIRLCLARLEPEEGSPFLTNAIKDWLRGELSLISSLKEALIYQKITRHNARHMLFSLAHWLTLNGKNGFILVLDVSRYSMPTRARDSLAGNYYSIPAALDAYELLRQFVDGTDEMESSFITVIAGKSFLVDERRGVARYDALKLRIWDEVRDKNRQNPFASLIRLTSA
jgi:hypothetical protein